MLLVHLDRDLSIPFELGRGRLFQEIRNRPMALFGMFLTTQGAPLFCHEFSREAPRHLSLKTLPERMLHFEYAIYFSGYLIYPKSICGD